MGDEQLSNITAEGLRDAIEASREGSYLLVDVRQPAEYDAGHIPGSILMPIPELETRVFSLPDDRDLLFYCRNGGRSLAAAFLAVDAEITDRRIMNLQGGIDAWEGRTLQGLPRVKVFGEAPPEAHLITAMALEKCAWRFYTHIADNYPDLPIGVVLRRLASAEVDHARTVYRFLRSLVEDPLDFESLYGKIEGNILEGGESLEDALARISAEAGGEPCMSAVELALHMELSAFDLYRNMAERVDDPVAVEAFNTLAQSEKGHMRVLIQGIELCPPRDTSSR
jgi:rhodanese-related sulfurtransferase/rubrerythrin